MVKQITYYKDFNIIKSHQKSIILIGNFDGLHLGHQKLFNKAKDYKKKKKLKIGVISLLILYQKCFFLQILKIIEFLI